MKPCTLSFTYQINYVSAQNL